MEELGRMINVIIGMPLQVVKELWAYNKTFHNSILKIISNGVS